MKNWQTDRFISALATLQTVKKSRNEQDEDAPRTATPRFFTISRQAGLSGKRLGDKLSKAIILETPEAEPWNTWDKELVNKVAKDHHVQTKLIEALEEVDHHWLTEFVKDLSPGDDPSDFKVYRHVAMTIRALAAAGNAIIVGRGGAFITAGIPGGIDVRLIAPVDYRIRQMSERLQLPLKEAEIKVNETDRHRAAFYSRFWPSKFVGPESFTLTFNLARMSEAQIVACLIPLVIRESDKENQNTERVLQKQYAQAGQRTGEQNGGAS